MAAGEITLAKIDIERIPQWSRWVQRVVRLSTGNSPISRDFTPVFISDLRLAFGAIYLVVISPRSRNRIAP